MTVRRRLKRRGSLKDFIAYGASKFEYFYLRRFSLDTLKKIQLISNKAEQVERKSEICNVYQPICNQC